jgi:hypothetical protein
LATGVASMTLTTAAVFAVGWFIIPEPQPCGYDALCIPNLAPLILTIMSAPVLLAGFGPLIARLLRFPRPGYFAAPAGWLLVWACLGPFRGRASGNWPFDSVSTNITILLILFCLIALLIPRQRRYSPRLQMEPPS